MRFDLRFVLPAAVTLLFCASDACALQQNKLITTDMRADSMAPVGRVFLLAAIGSASGTAATWYLSGRDLDGGSPFLAVAGGTAGCIVGGTIARWKAVAPTSSALGGGCVGGILAGLVLGYATARAFDRQDPELPEEGWTIGFAIGQAAFATWIGKARGTAND